ncbi:MAG: hypothetical protein MRY83_03770 [Flavobacteriales bacterium]|nr:hypothetical protein [Flavobacteriales bacterium]
MIKRNKHIEIPHGNSSIWRYMGLGKFLDLVVSKSLYFANASEMTDQYEGLMPKRNVQAKIGQLVDAGLAKNEAEAQALQLAQQYRNWRSQTIINCWTLSPHESYALWKIYLGGSISGVAIKSSIRHFIKSVEQSDEPIYYGKVNYADFIPEAEQNRFRIITTKTKYYDYEKEVRFFMVNEDEPYLQGKSIKIDIESLIQEIYVSPFSGKWFENSFLQIIKKLTPKLVDRIKISDIRDQ